MKKLIIKFALPLILITFLSGDLFLCTDTKADDKGRLQFNLPSEELIKNLPPDGGSKYNRLIFEKSPYLLQHATNPVDWYPWGDEAFEKARKEDKPIFLSIGYSTCHWCHVMEEESFSSKEVAKILNKYFVAIKVDREERPDIDKVYMNILQAATGSGGWPMTIIMTPDKKPFFAGTYFSKTAQFGKPGLLQILPSIAETWKNERKKILDIAKEWDTAISTLTFESPGPFPDNEIIIKTFNNLSSSFDSKSGGFLFQPVKFPLPNNILFLIRYWNQTKDAQALEMVEKTLTNMRLGGIYDHIGFGFHRYSTDHDWLVPHFEKMLYDQALISLAYVEAYQATGNNLYVKTVKEIYEYVFRELTSPKGAFYSAEDADSEGEEGKFYLWSKKEIIDVLGKREGEFFSEIFNIEEDGNFYDRITGEKTGKNIIYLRDELSSIAKKKGVNPISLHQRIERDRKKLFSAREKRIKPFKDDKILTDWNGLMIASLAKASVVLNEKTYAEKAEKAADFILANLRKDNGRLLKRYRDGESGLAAHLEDYAYLTWGLIELYESTFETRYLKEALNLSDIMIDDFFDKEKGGFFFSSNEGEKLLMKIKEIYDGVTPSGNSVAVMNLLRLSRITGNKKYGKIAEKTIKAFAGEIESAPHTYTYLMSAIDYIINPGFEIVIAGNMQASDTKKMLSAIWKKYLPNTVIIFRPDNSKHAEIIKLASYVANMKSLKGKATAYVCRNFACNLPTTDIKNMLELIGEK
ncbi:MAG: thioredoxin domain-containing protein [Candidatus Schekmanbacteria bacterium]|nr:MAG: thioredoxin domain-containing protein [Candidatus Schekmanbacteria bacterium]